MSAVALCHEWLAQRSGSEKTFEAMAAALPDADLYALTLSRTAEFQLEDRTVATTFLDRLAPLEGRRALQLPLMPLAWRCASRQRYEVVVTSSHACAKGFWPGRTALHLCYCYTPMRYAWLSEVDRRGGPSSAARLASAAFRRWDRASADWVDEFAAISRAVADRITRFYGRPATVIHPPVDTDFFTPEPSGSREGFALAVSRMVPYKRLDLALRACSDLGLPLVVAGSGPQEGALRQLAAGIGACVRFVVDATDRDLRDLYRRARVVVFPAEEDFGIVPVEALACGTPVVALARGGALDTVDVPGTGQLVGEQTVDNFAAGIQAVLDEGSDASGCRQSAERFSIARFQRELSGWIAHACASRGVAAESLCRASR